MHAAATVQRVRVSCPWSRTFTDAISATAADTSKAQTTSSSAIAGTASKSGGLKSRVNRKPIGVEFCEDFRSDSACPLTPKGQTAFEFETYLMRLLKEYGVDDIRNTVATGDQGAELIAHLNDRSIVIQAKHPGFCWQPCGPRGCWGREILSGRMKRGL